MNFGNRGKWQKHTKELFLASVRQWQCNSCKNKLEQINPWISIYWGSSGKVAHNTNMTAKIKLVRQSKPQDLSIEAGFPVCFFTISLFFFLFFFINFRTMGNPAQVVWFFENDHIHSGMHLVSSKFQMFASFSCIENGSGNYRGASRHNKAKNFTLSIAPTNMYSCTWFNVIKLILTSQFSSNSSEFFFQFSWCYWKQMFNISLLQHWNHLILFLQKT